MTNYLPSILELISGRPPSNPRPAAGADLAPVVFVGGHGGVLLASGGALLVVLIGLIDAETTSRFSFSLFYLLPVAVCAWWGGFSCGILVALAAALSWHTVDSLHLVLSPTVGVWNGVVRFGVMTLVSSLVSRLHLGVRRECLLARTDPLTGAANGRTFYEAAAAEANRSRRTSSLLTLAYLDLDNFKQLNDRLGHTVGDAALVQIVHTASLHLRSSDLLARLGGDEFALLLPDTDAAGATALLDRLHRALSREMTVRDWPVSLSVGAITFVQPPLDVDLMVQQVDAIMYRAKSKGKGRVEHEVATIAPGNEVAGRVERRAMARVICTRLARVWQEGQAEQAEDCATVRDLSRTGIRLHLEKRFLVGTLLVIGPLTPGARTLLARVVRLTPAGGSWEHGCDLSTRLSEEELSSWLKEQRDFPSR